CPAGLRELDVRDDIFDVLGRDHHTLTKVEWPGATRQFAFEAGAREARFSIGRSTGRETASFVLLGVEHILTGWDHLLFLLGLVHGFGCSSALRALGLPSHGLLLSLFGFNAGVEIGQALVVAVALPALVLVRNTRWERRMIWSSSLAILLVGVVLFVERAFF